MLRAMLLPGAKEFKMWIKLIPVFTVLVSALLAQPPGQNTNSPDELRAMLKAQNPEAKPAPTKIGLHQMGESLSLWLQAENVSNPGNPENACRTQAKALYDYYMNQDHPFSTTANSESFSVYQACMKELTNIIIGQPGSLTVDEFKDGWYKSRELVWGFAQEKLVKVMISIPGFYEANKEPDIPQEIKFLTEAYGSPMSTGKNVYQNSYGAKWDCLEVSWGLPDGVLIVAHEYIRNTDEGPRRGLDIGFISKDAPEAKKPPVTNPYIH
jgi:hypothetical protein